MDAQNSDDLAPTFCVGQHESKRSQPITTQTVQLAHECNYDMLTTPITSPHFHSRVLTLLSAHLSNLQAPSFDANGSLHTSHNTKPLIIPPLSPVDTPLTPNEAISQLVGVTSPWIDLCSPDPLIADISRQVLALEIAYAAFCGLSYVMVPGPRLHHGGAHGDGVMYYARAIQEILSVGPYIQVHIWLRMVDHPELETDEIGDLAPFAREEFLEDELDDLDQPRKPDLFGTWDAWDIIRKVCKYHTRLVVALTLPKHLPPMAVQSRWHSEPVHLLTIEATSFIKNPKGYPVLSKAHQALISRHMRLRTPPWILLSDVGLIPGADINEEDTANNSTMNMDSTAGGHSSYPTLSESSARISASSKKSVDPTPHLSYIRNLQQKQPPRSALERFGTGYQDYLQAPLQPLTVNLESITYEVFEKDPIKYEWYERAIAKALRDWVDNKKPTSNPDGRVVIAVVGAGRGPLVTRALRASAETGVNVEVWAVEKNQNAYVLLQRHNENLWGESVNLVKSDMRSWKGPWRKVVRDAKRKSAPVGQAISEAEAAQAAGKSAATDVGVEAQRQIVHMPIDILVSELLGSFADNELSPECLDGVTHLLNPVHGISIPASYSAHLTPIAAPRLHADVTAQTVSNPAAPETPYVVMLHAIDFLSSTQPPPTAAPIGSPPGSRSNTPGKSTPPPVAAEPSTPIVETAWSFSHPNPNVVPQDPSSSTVSNAHNVRQTRLSFPCQHRGVCHGLAGYFETVLYGDIELSTNPVTMEGKSPSMISWFPIYFPLKTPLYIPDKSEVVITMFRQTDDRKVWYEWFVEVFTFERTIRTPPSESGDEKNKERGKTTGIPTLRRVRVGMSEMHSSIKEGCLM